MTPAEQLRRDTARMILDRRAAMLARTDAETRDAHARGDTRTANLLLDLRNDWGALAERADRLLND